MSDFAKFCPKCYAFFRDPDLFAKHVEVCGFAKDKKNAGKEPVDGKPQTAAEEKKDRKRQTVEPKSQGTEKVENNQQTAADESAADCGLPSAVATEGGSPQVKSPKFKT